MTPPPNAPQPVPGSALGILLGIARLARGRVSGMAGFAGTPQAFLSSLAPWVAISLLGGVLLAAADQTLGGVTAAITESLSALCALLAPAVLSHALARRWGQEAAWCRYAAAFNWCQWALPVVLAGTLIGLSLVVAAVPGSAMAGSRTALLAFSTYALWLHWFLVRSGLGFSRGRAAGFVVLVNLGTVVLLTLPRLAMWLVDGPVAAG